ncbi:MAG: SAM-dependent methyltransferase, partial [Dehalococcoidia bacterium]
MTSPSTSSAPTRVIRPTGSTCANCGHALSHVFADLGWQPLCESFVPASAAMRAEAFYPLIAYVCQRCFLVQVPAVVRPEDIFTDYAYFSSYSDSWVEHAQRYVETVVDRFGLGADSFVVELASNDGYLLQGFVERSIPCLGIEPAENVAAEAIARGVPTRSEFFGAELASELVADGPRADLMIGNNVLAQVPGTHDFIEGIRILLAPEGVLTLEFPHLTKLMDGNEFDTIYHEHFFYFSLYAVRNLLSA